MKSFYDSSIAIETMRILTKISGDLNNREGEKRTADRAQTAIFF
jgi:hypothetical protein